MKTLHPSVQIVNPEYGAARWRGLHGEGLISWR